MTIITLSPQPTAGTGVVAVLLVDAALTGFAIGQKQPAASPSGEAHYSAVSHAEPIHPAIASGADRR